MSNNTLEKIKIQLDNAVSKYNSSYFIDTDPIQIPHAFVQKEDIEIAAFLSSSIAWGQRKTIINNGRKLMQMMDNTPHDFVLHASPHEIEELCSFVHRTFNASDLSYFILSLRNIYSNVGGLESVFTNAYATNNNIFDAISVFRDVFLQLPHNTHVRKHVSDVKANSAAKRINMFLRWMVRTDENAVDFGLWKNISPAHLIRPCDLHVDRVGRKLGLIERKQTDWLTAIQLTEKLREFDPEDPVKYDFALFGLGIEEKF